MSFCPARMMMSAAREVDFTGATVLQLFPAGVSFSQQDRQFSVYSAKMAPGNDSVAVDWGDGTTEKLVPDSDGNVILSHQYVSSAPRIVRIQNKLSYLQFSHLEPYSGNHMYLGLKNTSDYMHVGARALSAVSNLGSNVQNRTLCPGMFSNTSVSAYPLAYAAPALSSTNSSALCIPFGCFYMCGRLANLDGIPAGLKAIDAYAFAGCSSLSSVSGLSASAGLLHIGFFAFARCVSLVSTSGISATLNPTPSNLFGGSLGLEALRTAMFPRPESYNDSIPVVDRTYRMNMFMYGLAPCAFYGCTNLTDISGIGLPNAARMPYGVFQGCSSLANVPASIRDARYAIAEFRTTYAQGNAHYVAVGQAPVNYSTKGLTDTYYWYYRLAPVWFNGDPNGSGFYIRGAFSATGVTSPIGFDSIYDTYYQTRYRSIFIDGEFADCKAMTQAVFSHQTEYLNIGAGAFSGCDNLKDVRFPNLTKAYVQNTIWGVKNDPSSMYYSPNGPTYPFGLPRGCVITCSDGTLTVA